MNGISVCTDVRSVSTVWRDGNRPWVHWSVNCEARQLWRKSCGAERWCVFLQNGSLTQAGLPSASSYWAQTWTRIQNGDTSGVWICLTSSAMPENEYVVLWPNSILHIMQYTVHTYYIVLAVSIPTGNETSTILNSTASSPSHLKI